MRVTGNKIALALLAALTLLAVGCGVAPTATPGGPGSGDGMATATATPTFVTSSRDELPACVTTLVGRDVWGLVRGEDPVPSAADAYNSMGCTFQRPVVAVEVVLRSMEYAQAFLRTLDSPATHVGFPVDGFETLPSDMPAGEYEREVWAVYEGGAKWRVVQAQEQVIVLAHRSDPLPTATPRATPTPRPEILMLAFAPEAEPDVTPLIDTFFAEHGELIGMHSPNERIVERLIAEHAAAVNTTDIAVVDQAGADSLAAYGVVEATYALPGAEEWRVVVLSSGLNPEATERFVEWLGLE